MKLLRPPSTLLSTISPTRQFFQSSLQTLQPHTPKRSFLNFTTPPPHSFSATRRLSHPPRQLFNLISDIDSYHEFIPYCTSSSVTSRSPQSNLPTSAELRVGWGSLVDETFTSQLHCLLPGEGEREGAGVVEADASAGANGVFSLLKAKWRIQAEEGMKGQEEEGSDVRLEIEYQFTNPLYASLSEAVMPQVAGKMIEAFERRADDVLRRK